MPLYVYKCDKCKKVFEILIPLKDSDKVVDCRYCEKPLEKLMTPVSFRIN
jgi:putative FmdB family regulatory protein